MNSLISELCSWTDKSIGNICISMKNLYNSCQKNESEFVKSRKLFFIKWNALENLNEMAKMHVLSNYDSFKKSGFNYSDIFYECLKKYESNIIDFENINSEIVSKNFIHELNIDYFINDEYFVQKIVDFHLFEAHEYFYNHF